jgi:hypothetical protein
MTDPSRYFPLEEFSLPERSQSKGKILLVKRTAKTPNYDRQQLTSGSVLLVMKFQNPERKKR